MSPTVPVSRLPRATLLALIEHFPFKPYRYYRTYSRREQHAILEAEIDATLAVAGEFSRALEGERPAAVIARPLAWDSAFFGVPMGRLDYVIASPETTRLERAALIGAVCDAARAARLQHLTARVDVADLDTLAVLEDHGFRTMDALVTYIMRPVKDPPSDIRTVGTIRESRPEDHDEIVAITREAYRGYRGRFHLDPNLSPARADEFYVEWARQCVAGAMADTHVEPRHADLRRRAGRLPARDAGRLREPDSRRHALVACARRDGRVPDAELQLRRHPRLRSGRRALRPRRVHAARLARRVGLTAVLDFEGCPDRAGNAPATVGG
jgi:hypothetical protein